ncbi:MAG: hypothetical protein AAB842_00540 [Patescibacteria group bacterium]
MKTYQVTLTKSYAVVVKADNAEKAKRFAESYTNDIKDTSTVEDRKKYNFLIEEIERGINEGLRAEEI